MQKIKEQKPMLLSPGTFFLKSLLEHMKTHTPGLPCDISPRIALVAVAFV